MKRGRPPYDDILTPREWQVLDLLGEGLTNEEIAERLGISFGAAKYHVAEILSKLGAENRQAAVEIARRRKRRSLVAWPAPLAWTLGAAALAAVVFVLAITLLGDGESKHLSAALPAVPAQLDEAQATSPFPNTLLPAKTTPVNVGRTGETIASLRTVRTLAELKAALGPRVNLIVVDKSAVSELIGSDFVAKEMAAGRAFMGLNLCLADPPEARFGIAPTPAAGPAWEISPSGEVRYLYPSAAPAMRCQMPIPQANVPYFSFQTLPTEQQRRALTGWQGTFLGGAVMRFSGSFPGNSGLEEALDETFKRVLTLLDAGERTGLLPTPDHCESNQPDGVWRHVGCPRPGP